MQFLRYGYTEYVRRALESAGVDLDALRGVTSDGAQGLFCG